MRTIRQTLGVAVAALAVVSLGACAPVQVRASLERGMDFTRYASYAWAAEEDFNTGDPRLDNNEFFQNRLRAGVEKALAAHGFEKATPATADLIVHYHASTTQKIDVNELDYQYGYCEECSSSIYDAGTITIDLVDAKTRKLVWRGWSDGTLDGIDNQAMIESRVDEAVTKIMQKLPPRI